VAENGVEVLMVFGKKEGPFLGVDRGVAGKGEDTGEPVVVWKENLGQRTLIPRRDLPLKVLNICHHEFYTQISALLSV